MSIKWADYCLKHMGIDVWQAQLGLPGAKQVVDCQYFKLMRAVDNVSLGSLLLQMMVATEQQQSKVQSLIEAMLFALGLRTEPMDKVLLPHDGVIVILGYSLAQKILPVLQPLTEPQPLSEERICAPRIITSYHPLELLQQPLLKAKVWKDLHVINNTKDSHEKSI
ncbi:MAG TPA: hypothetical protein VHE99_07520 [Gammaproteobacteria bacterium]|nr:hypothetical protein [Gammaproteobacteria bacterium]